MRPRGKADLEVNVRASRIAVSANIKTSPSRFANSGSVLHVLA